MEKAKPLILTSFSTEAFRFQAPSRKAEEGTVVIRSPLLNPKGYVPYSFYTFQLVEGDNSKSWLKGLLTGYETRSEVTSLRFAITYAECPHGDFTLEVRNYQFWTCRLVGGERYSLIVRPVEGPPA